MTDLEQSVAPSFSNTSAQNTSLAVQETQEWIEAVTGRTFSASFRESLEDGVLLCQLMRKINPGSIRKINKSPSPIAYLDNIQQFLIACRELGLKDAQLFDTMDLQEPKGTKGGAKRTEADRRIRSVCITLYWLGRTVAGKEDYTGPQLDLEAFRNIMNLSHVSYSDDDSPLEHGYEDHAPPVEEENGFRLTFEQEQTADQLLADIQSAVDEMLLDFQQNSLLTEPTPPSISSHPPPTQAQHSPHPIPNHEGTRLGVSVHMSSRNRSFGFQVVGGLDMGVSPQVELVLPGSAAEEAGVMAGDEIVSVNKQDVVYLPHHDIIALIKKAGAEGGMTLGLVRTMQPNGLESPRVDPISLPSQHPPFSHKESEILWQEEHRERERQAQEIELLYPHHTSSLPPSTMGLPPLIEEAVAELSTVLQHYPTPQMEPYSLQPQPRQHSPLPQQESYSPPVPLQPMPHSPPPQVETHSPLHQPKPHSPPPQVETHFPLHQPKPHSLPPQVETHSPLHQPKPHSPPPQVETHSPLHQPKPHSPPPQVETHSPLHQPKPHSPPPQVETHSPLHQPKPHSPPPQVETHSPLHQPKPHSPPPTVETHSPLHQPKPHSPPPAVETHSPLHQPKPQSPSYTQPALRSPLKEMEPTEQLIPEPVEVENALSVYEPEEIIETMPPVQQQERKPMEESKRKVYKPQEEREPPHKEMAPLSSERKPSPPPTLPKPSRRKPEQPPVPQTKPSSPPVSTEIHGGIKISHVQRTRWTPQSNGKPQHWTQQMSIESTETQSTPSRPIQRDAWRHTWGPRDRVIDGPQAVYTLKAADMYELCLQCHQPLGSGAVMAIPPLKLQYHAHCFVCYVCRTPLSSGLRNTSVMMLNRHPHCRFCYSDNHGIMTTEC